MSTLVDARIPAREFALGQSFRDHPDATFEICRAVANTSDQIVPFLWGSGPDLDGLHRSLTRDPTVQDAHVVSEFDEEYLFKMEWTAKVQLHFTTFLDQDGSALLDAHCTDGEWHFRLVYPDDQCIQAVREECADMGVTLDIERVYPLSESFTRDQFELTEKQYETVLAAYECGYYDIPRTINLKELADRLDVSHQALSERLRRGHETLIENGLGVTPEGSIVPDPEGRMSRPPLSHPSGE